MSVSTISIACRGIRFAVEASRIVNSAEKILQRPDVDDAAFLRKASFANKCFLLITATGEMIGIMKGSSFSTLGNWKAAEVLGRFVDYGIKSVEASEEGWSGLELFERGILAPLTSLIRSLNDGNIYQEKEYLELSPEEFAKVRRPIVNEKRDIVGWRSTTKEECEHLLQAAQENEPTLNVAELVFMNGTCTKTVQAVEDTKDQITNIYCALADRLRARSVAVHPPAEPVPVPAALNLLALNEIPGELHNDAIFQRYICPITQLPIRHPVGDPNGTTVYERAAIESWIARRRVSPITHEPLRPNQLLAKPALQLLIDNRLSYHEVRLRHEAEIVELQQQADVENPSY